MKQKFCLQKRVDIMTLKSDIRSVLSSLFNGSEYSYFYGLSKSQSIPYIRYFLGNNHTDRLSNKKSIRNIWYQIDVFTYIPIDVEDKESILYQIESGLEKKNLTTTDWMENFSENNNTRYTIYHYFIEVRA